MRVRAPLVFVVLFVTTLGTTPLRAADLSGPWTFTMLPDFRGNRAVVTCILNQHGTQITVQCGQGKEMIGEIRGKRITYRSPPLPENDKFVATFSGHINRDGTAINGKWQLVLTDGTREGHFSAVKK